MSAFRSILLLAALVASVPALPFEPDKLFEKVSASVVVVWAIDLSGEKLVQGSGIVISPGEAVTNCHVITKANSIVIEQGKRQSKARLRYFDADRDLCQLAMENRIGTPIAGIVSYQELKVGQRVYSVGAPKGLELSLGEGLISQLRGGEEFDFIQTTAPVSHGSSGGGLFDKEGRLIGITTFILADGQSLNFAIPADWIFELAPRHAEAEQKRTEERRRVDEAKREDYRKQRAAAAERERQQQEIAHKQRDAEETKRRAEAAARVAEVRNESPRLPESPNVDYPVPPGSFVLGGVEFSEASGRVLVTRISARAKTTLRVGDQLVSCPTFHSVGSISDLRGCGPMERVDDKSEKKQFVFFITRDGMETPKSVIVDKKQAAWPR